MPHPTTGPYGESAPGFIYGVNYYYEEGGGPRSSFNFDPERDMARAQAIVEAADIPPGGRILDFGCGLGTMTVAFSMLGYEVVGVDTSTAAVENALPEAQGLVNHLESDGLDEFPNDSFDLVFAKDVFEHVPEDDLHGLVQELLCIGKKVLAVIPITDEDNHFIFEKYEDDPSHVTRLTRSHWIGFFPYAKVLDLEELTPQIRRADKVEGTLCLLIEETDPDWRRTYTDWRDRRREPFWPAYFRRLLRSFGPPPRSSRR